MRAGYIPPLQQSVPNCFGRGGIYAALFQYEEKRPEGATDISRRLLLGAVLLQQRLEPQVIAEGVPDGVNAKRSN